MIHDAIEEFAASLPKHRAVMGLDLGDKTVGVAVSDLMGTVATPLETVRRKKFTLDAARLLEIIKGRDIAGIVQPKPYFVKAYNFGQAQILLKLIVKLCLRKLV